MSEVGGRPIESASSTLSFYRVAKSLRCLVAEISTKSSEWRGEEGGSLAGTRYVVSGLERRPIDSGSRELSICCVTTLLRLLLDELRTEKRGDTCGVMSKESGAYSTRSLMICTSLTCSRVSRLASSDGDSNPTKAQIRRFRCIVSRCCCVVWLRRYRENSPIDEENGRARLVGTRHVVSEVLRRPNDSANQALSFCGLTELPRALLAGISKEKAVVEGIRLRGSNTSSRNFANAWNVRLMSAS